MAKKKSKIRDLVETVESWVGMGPARASRKDYKRRIEEALHRFERFQLAE